MSIKVGSEIQNEIFGKSAEIGNVIVLSAKNTETKKFNGRKEIITKIKHEIDFVFGKTK